jgi:hypothetical protein
MALSQLDTRRNESTDVPDIRALQIELNCARRSQVWQQESMTQLPHHVGLQTRTQFPHHVGLQSRTLARLGSSTWADSSNTFGGGGTCEDGRPCAEVGAGAHASAPAQRAAVARAASDSHPGRAPASRGDSSASERRTASESGVFRVRPDGQAGRSAFQQGPVSWNLHRPRPCPSDAERDPATALARPRIGSAARRASARDLRSSEVNSQVHGQVQVQESAKLRQRQGTSGPVAADHRPQSRRYCLQNQVEREERDVFLTRPSQRLTATLRRPLHPYFLASLLLY